MTTTLNVYRSRFPVRNEMIARHWRRSGYAVTLLAALAGCAKHDTRTPADSSAPSNVPAATTDGDDAGSRAIAATLAKLTPNEVKWGVSPTRNDKVTYQDDVIIMEHGADAVKAMAPNGLIWTIDAKAPHADEIKVGKILFATGRVMGRIMAITPKGDGLDVLLGPVAITDVIRDADLTADQPVNLEKMLVYTAPNYPAAINPDSTATTAMRDDSALPLLFAGYTRRQMAQDVPFIGPAKQITIDNFTVDPACCHGLGIILSHNGQGVKLRAMATVLLPSGSSVYFKLRIVKGTIVTALVELRGVAGLEVTFAASTDVGVQGNIHHDFVVPADVTIPIGGLFVPLSVVFRQTLTLTTMFTAQNGTVTANGKYQFKGSIKAGRENGGAWDVSAPTEVLTAGNLTNSVAGLSIGVNGLVFGYGAKVIVGIGAYGFVTGPYVSFNPVVGVTAGSTMTAAGMPPCRSAILDINMRYGVGYQIPEWAASAINLFTEPFGAAPIKSAGGFENEKRLKHSYEAFPAGCGTEPNG